MSTTLLGHVRWIALLGVLAAGACKATPPTNFYILTSRADADAQAGVRTETGPLLGIGPIELPDYLDRPQIVTRTSDNVLALSEFNQWAEPLQGAITRVLAEDLSDLLPVERIAVFPWKRADAVDLQVAVRVARFEVASDQARFVAEWRLMSGDGSEVLTRRSSFVEPVSGADYAARVAAMSRALASLSTEIAAGIESASGE